MSAQQPLDSGGTPASTAGVVPLTVWGPIRPEDLPGLTSRVCALLTSNHGSVAECDVAGVLPDVPNVEALARLQLAARRQGGQIRLRNASDELLQIAALMGLGDAF